MCEDLPDRLRYEWPNLSTAIDAAREIERLRAELAAERERRGDLSEWELHVEIELLRANVAKLREALEQIADAKPVEETLEIRAEWLQEIARAVLAETGGGHE